MPVPKGQSVRTFTDAERDDYLRRYDAMRGRLGTEAIARQLKIGYSTLQGWLRWRAMREGAEVLKQGQGQRQRNGAKPAALPEPVTIGPADIVPGDPPPESEPGSPELEGACDLALTELRSVARAHAGRVLAAALAELAAEALAKSGGE